MKIVLHVGYPKLDLPEPAEKMEDKASGILFFQIAVSCGLMRTVETFNWYEEVWRGGGEGSAKALKIWKGDWKSATFRGGILLLA